MFVICKFQNWNVVYTGFAGFDIFVKHFFSGRVLLISIKTLFMQIVFEIQIIQNLLIISKIT